MNSTTDGIVSLTPPSSTGNYMQVVEILLAVWVYVAIKSVRKGRVEGLPVWPVVGMLPSLLIALGLRRDIYEWLSDVLVRQNGTFRFRGPSFSSLNCVVTADPENLEHLLKTKFSSFPKGAYFRNALADLLGDGIFNADDDTWMRQRKIASLEFHSARFRHLTTRSLAELVHSRLIPVLDNNSFNNSAFDLQDVLLRLTFDNVCMMAFGVDPGCLREGLPEIPFARAFEDATEASALRFVMPTCVWKALRWVNAGPERRLKESIKALDAFASDVIRARRAELQEAGGSDDDLLTVFMRRSSGSGDRFLRDICVNMILAGRDTSSVALTWFFWLLSGHSEVEERIVEEIRGVLAAGGGVVFTSEEVKRMEYLHAALSEALRLYPSVPVDHKEVVEDEVFPADGTVLKKGTKVIYSIYAMGRMEAIWGKDCREFKPERWLRDGRFVSESAYKFPAFNGGPRFCLGKDFAYYQMKFVAASIISRYHVNVVEGHPVTPKLALTMYMKHGLRARLIKRNDFELAL